MSAPRSWTRVALGLRSALAALLAVGAALLAVDLSEWRYVRLDLTEARSNTLDPVVLDVIDRLPEPVEIDVFVRPLARPYDRLSAQIQTGLFEWLSVIANARRQRIHVRQHDPRDFEEIQERQRELGVTGTNKLILTCGSRHDELQLFGELWSVDWGSPTPELVAYLSAQGIPGIVDPRSYQPGRPFRPATLSEFHGAELLVQSLNKIASGRAPVVYFARGHGEPALEGGGPQDLSRLRQALEGDGFTVKTWDAQVEPSVPQNCEVLALIGPGQPYSQRMREAVRDYTARGGRLLAAPAIEELQEAREGGVVDLLREYGVLTRPGIVCQPLVGNAGERVEGAPECAWLVIDERGLQPGHPLTEPLRLRGRRTQFTLSPSFESVGLQTDAGVILPLITSPADSWRDLEPYDFRCNPVKGEERGRFTLVAALQLRAHKAEDGSVAQGRVLAVASAYAFDGENIDENRDLALLAFNWLADREFRLAVRPLARGSSVLDFSRSSARPILTWVLWLALPATCALTGLALFLLRRRE